MSDCDEENCLFYKTEWCTDCRECTYCGSHIDRRNREMEHVRAHSSGGTTVVPVCRDCNRSKGSKGFVSWLKWLHENDPEKYRMIESYHWEKGAHPMPDLSRISKTVTDTEWENYSWWARVKKWAGY